MPFVIDPSNLDNLDPLFVDAANGDYHLQVCSPVIDMGDNNAPAIPDTDKDGNPRIVGGVVDMGAFEFCAQILEVAIDIKPGSFPNSINLKSKGVIPVAILTTEEFDATTVDPGTVRFGPGDATEKHGVGHIEDVDKDSDADVVYHFPTQDSGIQCGDTTATLTGTTFGGQPVMGSDSIVTRGCK